MFSPLPFLPPTMECFRLGKNRYFYNFGLVTRELAEKFPGWVVTEKLDRRIAPFSPLYFISIMYENPGGGTAPFPTLPTPMLGNTPFLSWLY